jgi:hypothetical protein
MTRESNIVIDEKDVGLLYQVVKTVEQAQS